MDTVRGINYQQGQALNLVVDSLIDPQVAFVRVEGKDEFLDVEVLDTGHRLVKAKQFKTRRGPATWARAELAEILRRWMRSNAGDETLFEFVTDGALGPSGEEVADLLDRIRDGKQGFEADVESLGFGSDAITSLRRARITVDPTPTGALIARAEKEVAKRLPSVTSVSEAQSVAEHGVGELLKILMDRGGNPDSTSRLISREEALRLLGIPEDFLPTHSWADAVRSRYIIALRDAINPHTIPPRIAPRFRDAPLRDEVEISAEGAIDQLLTSTGPTILSGRTGSGKSTASSWLAHRAAGEGQVVLVARIEAYLPTRLASLIADTIAGILDRDLPPATGLQFLRDNTATVVIDGASEADAATRRALANDLAHVVARERGAHIILAGRDEAALRAMMPVGSNLASMRLLPFDRDQRLALAKGVLGRVEEADIRGLLRQADLLLGDGRSNPLLLTLALEALARGSTFENRADLFQECVESMADRSGTEDLQIVQACLGIAFANLLNQARRYADVFEWKAQLDVAVRSLKESTLVDFSERSIDAAARRAGLVRTFGSLQTVGPVHDSFADYLAGYAHSRGLAAFPTSLSAADESRVRFLAQLQGTHFWLAEQVCRQRPFLAVELSNFDRPPAERAAASEVHTLLDHLLPEDVTTGLALWGDGSGRTICIPEDSGSCRWIGQDEGRARLLSEPTVIVRGGPLTIAIAVWRSVIRRALTVPGGYLPPRPRDRHHARDLLEAYAEQVDAQLKDLAVQIAPSGHAAQLAGLLGPKGLEAWILPAQEGPFGPEHPIRYRRVNDIAIHLAPPPSDVDVPYLGRSSVEHHTSTSPAAFASNDVIQAINRVTSSKWI